MMKTNHLKNTVLLLALGVTLCSAQQFEIPDFHSDASLPRQRRDNVRSQLLASDTSGFTMLGAWKWGRSDAVAVKDTLLYMGNGSLLQVYSIADTAVPRLLGEVDLFYTTNYAIVLKDSIAYIASSNLLAVSVENPRAPRLIAEVDLFATPTRMAAVDSFLYVVTFSGTFWVVDISDPSTLVRRGSCLTAGEQAHSVAARGRYAYGAGTDFPAFSVFDARNPDAPVRIFFQYGGIFAAHVVDTLLFVFGWDEQSQGQVGIIVYSVTQPSAPRRLAQLNTPLRSSPAISINDTILYLTEGDSVKAISVANPSNPRMLHAVRNTRPNISGANEISASHDYVFAAQGRGVWSLSFARQDSLRPQWFFPTGDVGLRIDLKDSLTFYTCDYAGLWILNTRDPQDIRPISNIVSSGETYDVVVADHFAFIVQGTHDTTRGVRIYDVSDPSNPVFASRFVGIDDYPPSSFGVLPQLSYSSNILAVTKPGRQDSILAELVDVSDAWNPISAGTVFGSGDPLKILVHDTLLLITTSTGLNVFSIANASQPICLSMLPGYYFGVEAHGSCLYATNLTGFQVIDITEPSNPEVVGYLDGVGAPSLNYANGFVFGGGLFAIDVRVPSAPRLSATYPLPGAAADHVSRGDTVYVAMNSVGVRILRHRGLTGIATGQSTSMPREVYLSPNYPNPFNPTTAISYQLTAFSFVTLKVFDVLGREVASLVNEEKSPGTHEVSWDGEGVASGVYFCRLTAGGFVQTRKLLLLR